jgi:hypothetical protein
MGGSSEKSERIRYMETEEVKSKCVKMLEPVGDGNVGELFSVEENYWGNGTIGEIIREIWSK